MTRTHLVISFLLCVLLSNDGYTQRSASQPLPRAVFLETVVLPAPDSEKPQLSITYRVMKNFFILTRTTSPQAEYEFEGGAEISVEVYDEHGRSRAREIVQHRIQSNDAQQEFPNIEYIQGGLTFYLEPGEYRLLIRIDDRNSSRRFVDRDRRVVIREFHRDSLEIYDVVFIEPVGKDPLNDFIVPINLGGDILFGKDSYAMLVFSHGFDVPPPVTVAIDELSPRDGIRRTLYSEELDSEFIYTGMLVERLNVNERVYFRLKESADGTIHTALFPIPAMQLDEGRYGMTVRIETDQGKRERGIPFSVQWIDKPFSLRNLDFAIEMLEYILPREEYRQLRRGSEHDRRQKFLQYWKGKDPDPETPFNPVMTEYYRRVDYAARAFSTLREQNGARTDRGKIYIIYGAPSSSERLLIPGQDPQEVWTYRHLNRKFIFADQTRQGNYRLIAREEL